jgi:hypothetical protein
LGSFSKLVPGLVTLVIDPHRQARTLLELRFEVAVKVTMTTLRSFPVCLQSSPMVVGGTLYSL